MNAANQPPVDVSVIVPVYNAMPYLRQCLDSLIAQTIGPARMEVIAVDDGSDDGGEFELDRCATERPQLFRVVHQPNSGGPALPCNRGLELAVGRYVFFLGADDYLGSEALERLVDRADEWDSDVIFGTMVGVNKRFVNQQIYAQTRRRVSFVDSALAHSLSNTKLFRRALIDTHHIRYSLDLPVGSDQPFVIEALIRAEVVSVLNDYVYYYAVRRLEASNITYASGWRDRLAFTTAIMGHVADLVEPGEVRDAIFARHFGTEVGKLLRVDLPDLDSDDQQTLIDGVRTLLDRYASDGISRRLSAEARIRLRLIATHQLDLLRTVLDFQRATRRPPLVLRDRGAYVWFPGFDEPNTATDWYAVTVEDPMAALVRSIRVRELALTGAALTIRARIGVTADSAANVAVALLRLDGEEPSPPDRRFPVASAPAAAEFAVRLRHKSDGGPSSLRAGVDVLSAVRTATRVTYALRLRVRVGEELYDLPVRWRGRAGPRTYGRGLGAYELSVAADENGFVLVTARRRSRTVAVRLAVRRTRAGVLAKLKRRRPPPHGSARPTHVEGED